MRLIQVRARVVGIVVAMLMAPGAVGAQPPKPPACEDTLRNLEQLAGIWARGRQQAEAELAAVRAQLEQAQRQLEAQKGKPADVPAKRE